MADTGMSDTGVSGVVAGLGLALDQSIADAAGLSAMAGPFLTANIVDAGGETIGCVAITDGPSGGQSGDAETLLERLASVAAIEAGGSVAIGEPVADGAAIAGRFAMPIAVQVFGQGESRVISVSATDRRSAERQAGLRGAVLDPASDTETARQAVPGPGGPGSGGASAGLDKLINVALDVSVELGRTRLTLSEVLEFEVGSVVELDRAAGAPVDVRVNDTLLAEGEVVLIDDEYAVRITAIFDQNHPKHH